MGVNISGSLIVVTTGGDSIPVPFGASGPDYGPGKTMYTNGSGGWGFDSRTTGVRIMDEAPPNNPAYRAVYMNETGQTVNPYTGQTIYMTDYWAHIPLKRG